MRTKRIKIYKFEELNRQTQRKRVIEWHTNKGFHNINEGDIDAGIEMFIAQGKEFLADGTLYSN